MRTRDQRQDQSILEAERQRKAEEAEMQRKEALVEEQSTKWFSPRYTKQMYEDSWTNEEAVQEAIARQKRAYQESKASFEDAWNDTYRTRSQKEKRYGRSRDGNMRRVFK